MRNKVSIKPIDTELAEELVQILNTDETMCQAMGIKCGNLTAQDFIDINQKWCTSTHAELFAIVLGATAIGTISLSHQDTARKTAQIGYWTGSAYWGNGYTSQAFEQVLAYARVKGFESVSATILVDNQASKRIWEKYGASFELRGDRYKASINVCGQGCPPGDGVY